MWTTKRRHGRDVRVSAPMSPITDTRRINPAALVLWRDHDILQVELGSNSVVIENIGPHEASDLLARTESSRRARPDASLNALRQALADTELLSEREIRSWPESIQLSGERRALTAQYGQQAGEVMARRQQAAVVVHGPARLAGLLAATIASAGVGHVHPVHRGDVTAFDACPGGLTPADEGRRFVEASIGAINRAAPQTETRPISGQRRPDLVILTDSGPPDPELAANLQRDGVAHLVVQIRGATSIIGPLVVPGESSCVRCADLHRTDRDPCWPLFAVQLTNRSAHRAQPDVGLTVATAGVAANQVLALLDRLDERAPSALNGTLEWQLPDWRLRRRSWPPHPDCDCGAASDSAEHGRMAL